MEECKHLENEKPVMSSLLIYITTVTKNYVLVCRIKLTTFNIQEQWPISSHRLNSAALRKPLKFNAFKLKQGRERDSCLEMRIQGEILQQEGHVTSCLQQ